LARSQPDERESGRLLQRGLDLNALWQSCRGLRRADFKDAVVEFGAKLLDIYTRGKSHYALEIAVSKFAMQVLRLPRRFSTLPGDRNRKRIALRFQVDVLRVNSR
jgi:hypothetical protein